MWGHLSNTKNGNRSWSGGYYCLILVDRYFIYSETWEWFTECQVNRPLPLVVLSCIVPIFRQVNSPMQVTGFSQICNIAHFMEVSVLCIIFLTWTWGQAIDMILLNTVKKLGLLRLKKNQKLAFLALSENDTGQNRTLSYILKNIMSPSFNWIQNM